MNEISNENYNKTYDEIIKVLKNATFIAVDTEFTGLQSSDSFKLSLFDTNKERYRKLKETIEPFVTIQFGITAFERIQDKNEYKAKSFNFYLLPRSIPIKNRQFMCQVAALEFLCSNGFDFNKVVHHGISYLNEEEEADLQQQLQNNTFSQNVEQIITYSEEDDIKDYVSKTEEWLNNSTPEEQALVIEIPSYTLQYLTQKELRKRFKTIWTVSNNESVMVVKVTEDVRKVIEEKDDNNLEQALLQSYIGFSRIFKFLVELKKPIVGHNVLLDLMFIYKQFYKPLPKKYEKFKTTIHQLFPIIYDTKFINYEIKRLLQQDDTWNFTSLSVLYRYFKNGKGKNFDLYTPKINLIDRNTTDVEKAHNAGWDSYFAGFIFINLAYVHAKDKYGNKNASKYLTNTEVMSAIQDYKNCIHVTRAQTPYWKLDGSDPKSTRPQWLFVQTLKPTCSMDEVAKKLSHFGTVDIKPFASRRLLIAVGNHGCTRDILTHFSSSKELYVAPYNPIRHSPKVKFMLWGGIFLSGGMLAWLVHRTMQKSVV